MVSRRNQFGKQTYTVGAKKNKKGVLTAYIEINGKVWQISVLDARSENAKQRGYTSWITLSETDFSNSRERYDNNARI